MAGLVRLGLPGTAAVRWASSAPVQPCAWRCLSAGREQAASATATSTSATAAADAAIGTGDGTAVAAGTRMLGLCVGHLRRVGGSSVPGRAHRGFWHGRRIGSGNTISDDKKTPTRNLRKFMPNICYKRVYSKILDREIKGTFSTKALRCIDRAGGFDAYILHTKASKLVSRRALDLQKEMWALVLDGKAEAPPAIIRLPRPPKSLEEQQPLPPAEEQQQATSP